MVELLKDESSTDEDSPEHILREATRHLMRSLELLDRILRIPPRAAPAVGPVSLRDHLEFLGALHHAHRSPVTLDLTGISSLRLPAVAAVDDHLEHVLLNLLVNAVEACADRAEGRISVTAAAANERVQLTVEDNGRGVPAEIEGRLFQPFATTRVDRPFAGLGLAVARELLSRTGGSLAYEAGRPAGARFVVTLPVWK